VGWIYDDPAVDLYDHEGRCVPLLTDGSEPDSVDGGWWAYDGQDGRPLAAAVKAACACGWRSELFYPINLDNHELTEGEEYSTGPWAAWAEHIRELVGTAVPPELAEALATVRELLAQAATERPLAALTVIGQLEHLVEHQAAIAATEARARRITWDAIGQALRVSRQAAHQRLSKHTTTTTEREAV
jgi:hypothetical protein